MNSLIIDIFTSRIKSPLCGGELSKTARTSNAGLKVVEGEHALHQPREEFRKPSPSAFAV